MKDSNANIAIGLEQLPVPVWQNLPEGQETAWWQPHKLSEWARVLPKDCLTYIEEVSSITRFVEDLDKLQETDEFKKLTGAKKVLISASLNTMVEHMEKVVQKTTDIDFQNQLRIDTQKIKFFVRKLGQDSTLRMVFSLKLHSL